MRSRFSLIEMSLEAATKKHDASLRSMNLRAPLREQPCIVVGPTGGYIVVELGIATREGWSVVK